MFGRGNANYYGKSCRHFEFRVGEHTGRNGPNQKNQQLLRTIC